MLDEMDGIAQRSRMAATGQQVVVVEDDTDIRQSTVLLLRDAGYTDCEAPDGKSALQRLHASNDRLVVLVDVKMPGMEGRELLEAVAAHDESAYPSRLHSDDGQ
jgi:two-component system response regulator HydG